MSDLENTEQVEPKERGSYVGVWIIVAFAVTVLVMALTGFNPHGH
jgi:hypothetical protein